MCDCYTTGCEGCGCEMDIHIADFCTKRKNVHPYCPRCTRKLVKKGLSKISKRVFRELLTCGGKYSGVQGGRKGQLVIIVCDDHKAYGICLN